MLKDVVPHFDHLDLMNALMLLMTLLISCNANTNFPVASHDANAEARGVILH